MVAIQAAPDEEFYLNCPATATHIIDNEPVAVPSPAPTQEELLLTVRRLRTERLISCDWTQTLDAPITNEQREAWAIYRQALRDFPTTCDTRNPVWPEPPQR
jgi:hypothetical protein